MSRSLLKILLPAFAGALVIAVWYGVHFYLAEEMRFLTAGPPPSWMYAKLDAPPGAARG